MSENDTCANDTERLTYWEFATLLELMMVSDPWPATDYLRSFLVGLLNEESESRGYSDWVEAYHEVRSMETDMERGESQ